MLNALISLFLLIVNGNTLIWIDIELMQKYFYHLIPRTELAWNVFRVKMCSKCEQKDTVYMYIILYNILVPSSGCLRALATDAQLSARLSARLSGHSEHEADPPNFDLFPLMLPSVCTAGVCVLYAVSQACNEGLWQMPSSETITRDSFHMFRCCWTTIATKKREERAINSPFNGKGWGTCQMWITVCFNRHPPEKKHLKQKLLPRNKKWRN